MHFRYKNGDFKIDDNLSVGLWVRNNMEKALAGCVFDKGADVGITSISSLVTRRFIPVLHHLTFNETNAKSKRWRNAIRLSTLLNGISCQLIIHKIYGVFVLVLYVNW